MDTSILLLVYKDFCKNKTTLEILYKIGVIPFS